MTENPQETPNNTNSITRLNNTYGRYDSYDKETLKQEIKNALLEIDPDDRLGSDEDLHDGILEKSLDLNFSTEGDQILALNSFQAIKKAATKLRDMHSFGSGDNYTTEELAAVSEILERTYKLCMYGGQKDVEWRGVNKDAIHIFRHAGSHATWLEEYYGRQYSNSLEQPTPKTKSEKRSLQKLQKTLKRNTNSWLTKAIESFDRAFELCDYDSSTEREEGQDAEIIDTDEYLPEKYQIALSRAVVRTQHIEKQFKGIRDIINRANALQSMVGNPQQRTASYARINKGLESKRDFITAQAQILREATIDLSTVLDLMHSPRSKKLLKHKRAMDFFYTQLSETANLHQKAVNTYVLYSQRTNLKRPGVEQRGFKSNFWGIMQPVDILIQELLPVLARMSIYSQFTEIFNKGKEVEISIESYEQFIKDIAFKIMLETKTEWTKNAKVARATQVAFSFGALKQEIIGVMQLAGTSWEHVVDQIDWIAQIEKSVIENNIEL